jgi:hypothetical protein
LKPLAFAILAVLSLGAWAEEVYRSVDDAGFVVYSDRPRGTDGEQRFEVATFVAPKPDEPAEAPPGANTVGRPASPLVAEMPRAPTPEEVAADRARNCEAAREKSETYNSARRLYRNLPDGEREYLSSEEIDAARAAAEADVDAWCD